MYNGSGGVPTPPSNSRYQLGVLQFNSLLTLFWHTHLETASDSTSEGISPTRLSSPSDQMQFQVLLILLPSGSRLEVPTTPSLGFINMLGWLTERRDTFYLLDYEFIVKEYNSGTARWERCIRQGIEKGHSTSHAVWCCHSPQISIFSSIQKLMELHPFGFLWRLHYVGMID